MKYIVLREFLSPETADLLVREYNRTDVPEFPLFLNDGDDMANKFYSSYRSELIYKYAESNTLRSINHFYQDIFSDMLVDSNFHNSINEKCLPFFCYGEGGYIKAHRGVQKERDTAKYQEYVAVAMLTQRGQDFENGKFYINPVATASPDGKTVYNDLHEDRIYPCLNKGDVCLFHNPSVVHGVTVVSGENAQRLTCSWRSN